MFQLGLESFWRRLTRARTFLSGHKRTSSSSLLALAQPTGRESHTQNMQGEKVRHGLPKKFANSRARQSGAGNSGNEIEKHFCSVLFSYCISQCPHSCQLFRPGCLAYECCCCCLHCYGYPSALSNQPTIGKLVSQLVSHLQ